MLAGAKEVFVSEGGRKMLDVRCQMLSGGKEAFLRANVESSIAAGRLQLAQQSGGGI